MKIAIAGSRSISDYNWFKKRLEEFLLLNSTISITTIISGGAMGVDKLAERYAVEKEIPIQVLIPDWKRLGKGAGLLRNTDIVNAADGVLVFWDGISTGSKDTERKAKEQKKWLHTFSL